MSNKQQVFDLDLRPDINFFGNLSKLHKNSIKVAKKSHAGCIETRYIIDATSVGGTVKSGWAQVIETTVWSFHKNRSSVFWCVTSREYGAIEK